MLYHGLFHIVFSAHYNVLADVRVKGHTTQIIRDTDWNSACSARVSERENNGAGGCICWVMLERKEALG